MTLSSPATDIATPRWFAVAAVGLATFSVVTTEMLPVGLLTLIAHSLNTSPGTAGLLISLPALLAAVFAPLVVLGAGKLDRRRLLCGLLALLAIVNLASALAPSFAWLLAARILVGLCMGGIWAIAGGLASRLVPAWAIGLASSIIFGGVAAASVLGVPLGALLGQAAGWRWAFGFMSVFSILVLVLLYALLPALPVSSSTHLRQFSTQLARRSVQLGLLLTVLLVAGHFMVFTFVRPLLLNVSGFDAQWISALLFAYGIAGITGNFLIGLLAHKYPLGSLAVIASGLLLSMLLYLTLGTSQLGGGSTLLVWGLAYGGVSVGLMSWMMKVAPDAVEIVTALYVAIFNIGIGLGSWAGGGLADSLGLSANLWIAAGLSLAALALIGYLRRHHN